MDNTLDNIDLENAVNYTDVYLQFQELMLDIIIFEAITFRNFKSIIFKKHIAICVLK